jgi:RNA polymerase sigma factor (sigma-70 family)
MDDPADRVVARHTVLLAVRQLPARQREVVALRFFDDLSVAETAAALRCTEGTVKTHTSRALSRLSELLADPRQTDPRQTEVSNVH